MRFVWLVSASGCVWIGTTVEVDVDDRDGDGYPVSVDCNDEDEDIDVLEARSGELRCGDRVEAVLEDGADELGVFNCVDPTDDRFVVRLGEYEHIYRFVSPGVTLVSITVEGGEIELEREREDEERTSLAVVRGSQCALDACTVGLPLTSTAVAENRPDWEPTVDLWTPAGEEWFVVVTGGGVGGTTSPYAVEVQCE